MESELWISEKNLFRSAWTYISCTFHFAEQVTSMMDNKPALHADFLLGLLFNHEDGDGMFPWSTYWPSTDYMALQTRKQNFHNHCCENNKSYIIAFHSFIHSSTALLPFVAFLQFHNHFTQTVGLLGWVISPSQGYYLHIQQHKHRINTHPLSGIWTHDPSVQARKQVHVLVRMTTVISKEYH
jgi:hypothetical protein